ncbi:MAG: hypothetical protein AAF636_19165 [Pseudomonadota bacterium]
MSPEIEKQPFPTLEPQSRLVAFGNDFQIEDEEEERRDLNARRDGLGARADALRSP